MQEQPLTMRPEDHAACEMLGLDPLYVVNEGKLVAIVAAEIGVGTAEHPGMVLMKSVIGGQRVVAMLSGGQLPRIF